MTRDERDDEICRRYLDGETAAAIGKDVGLTRERVRQILCQYRLLPGSPEYDLLPGIAPERPARKVRQSRRSFLGVVLSDDEKRAVRSEAARRGMSMSALTADLIRQMLESTK